jgi:hypothetical protein
MASFGGKFDGGDLRVTYTCPHCKHNILNSVTSKLAENAYIRCAGTHVLATCGKCNATVQMWKQPPGLCKPWGDFVAHWLGLKCSQESTRVLAYLWDDPAKGSRVCFDYLCETHYQQRVAGRNPWRRFYIGLAASGALLLGAAIAIQCFARSAPIGGDVISILLVLEGLAGTLLPYKGIMGMPAARKA